GKSLEGGRGRLGEEVESRDESGRWRPAEGREG
ncbi:MAG: hypothetical protein RLZZ447_2151, partial [Verrucomicrobiota bacterium]